MCSHRLYWPIGKILWARQIERQLRLLMQRMEDVLGAGWEKHVEGRQVRQGFVCVCAKSRRLLRAGRMECGGGVDLWQCWMSGCGVYMVTHEANLSLRV